MSRIKNILPFYCQFFAKNSLNIILIIFFVFNLVKAMVLEAHEVVLKEIDNLEAGIYSFQLDFNRFPNNEEGIKILFRRQSNNTLWRGPYVNLKFDQVDIWGNPYVYIYPAQYGKKDFDLYSYGKNKHNNFGKKDDISNWNGFSLKYYSNQKKKELSFYLVVLSLTILLSLILVIFKWLR